MLRRVTVPAKSASREKTWRIMSAAITEFKGEHRWLSNFHPAEVEFEGETYPSVEHAYQAAKSLDPTIRKLIREVLSPAEAKRVGGRISIREDWNQVKTKVMAGLLEQKFNIPELQEKLLATGSQDIVEGNYWHDNFWGRCYCAKCCNTGENNLGALIMDIRHDLKRQKSEQMAIKAAAYWVRKTAPEDDV